jgi:DNA-binding response OmpR family regulator
VGRLPILIIGTNPRNLELLAQFLGKEGYDTRSATTLDQFAEIIGSEEPMGLALVDIAGFDRSIWQHCENCTNVGIPLLLISPPPPPNPKVQALSTGARDVLFKPLVLKELMYLVKTMIREQ